ncbi:hypothetical protein PROFUN_00008 [Planoprotostelium fungivorum]|uniref:Uncharacterized protein n=1 Tax=Planoprotostelium fungivorum TaxID=1890364 RepID=A0A2P6P0C5_9EUKA|nr:hypothetical protein PROFUN_00008 [Planoprotostelium fungivorum]
MSRYSTNEPGEASSAVTFGYCLKNWVGDVSTDLLSFSEYLKNGARSQKFPTSDAAGSVVNTCGEEAYSAYDKIQRHTTYSVNRRS